MSIKVGDFVMVVRPTVCCGNARAIGLTYKVTEFYDGLVRCMACQEVLRASVANGEGIACGVGVNVSRLIKIDPPALPETIESENEVSV